MDSLAVRLFLQCGVVSSILDRKSFLILEGSSSGRRENASK